MTARYRTLLSPRGRGIVPGLGFNFHWEELSMRSHLNRPFVFVLLAVAWCLPPRLALAQPLATLKTLVAQAQGGGGGAPPVAVKEANGVVMVTVGNVPATLGQAGGAASLVNEKGFKDAMTQVGRDPSVAFYVNVEGIVAM